MSSNATMQVMSGISSALGISPLMIDMGESKPNTLPIVESVERTAAEKAAIKDFDLSRDNLIAIIESGRTALESALVIAESSQSPNAFDIVSKLVKSVSEANRGLLELHEARAALVPDRDVEVMPESVTNNTIVVGSAAELIALVDARRKAKKTEDAAQIIVEDDVGISD